MKALGLVIGGLTAAGLVAFAVSRPKQVSSALAPLPGIVSNAVTELSKWSGLTETMAQGLAFVKQYWSGSGNYFNSINDPWSAVFVVDQANKAAPGSLKRAQSHFAYAAQAYRDRGVKGKYGAYRPHELRLKPSDIIIRGREGNRPTFESLANSGQFIPTHGDIVSDVKPGIGYAIGGNVKNAVSQTTVALAPTGQVADPTVFAVLRYQA